MVEVYPAECVAFVSCMGQDDKRIDASRVSVGGVKCWRSEGDGRKSRGSRVYKEKEPRWMLPRSFHFLRRARLVIAKTGVLASGVWRLASGVTCLPWFGNRVRNKYTFFRLL